MKIIRITDRKEHTWNLPDFISVYISMQSQVPFRSRVQFMTRFSKFSQLKGKRLKSLTKGHQDIKWPSLGYILMTLVWINHTCRGKKSPERHSVFKLIR